MVIEALRILPHSKVKCAINMDEVVWVQPGDPNKWLVFPVNGPELVIVYEADLAADWISGKDSRT